ncbi:MAG: 4'-phosphopantetheinyl transferase family protein [Chloroflexota bacterium]
MAGEEVIWAPVPAGLTLGPGEVHLWRADLARLGDYLEDCAALLDEGERARAARFHFARDRERFTLAHGLLRLLLGRYAGAPPAALRFAAGPRGKPTLAGAPQGVGPHFNLSHSHLLALFAFARGTEVGVDVERVRADLPWPQLARRVCGEAEQALLAALPEEGGRARFFDLWAAKEAYAKALGEGLGLAMETVAVDLARAPRFRLLDLASGRADADWTGLLLSPAPGYAGAIVHRVGATLRYWQADASLFAQGGLVG